MDYWHENGDGVGAWVGGVGRREKERGEKRGSGRDRETQRMGGGEGAADIMTYSV